MTGTPHHPNLFVVGAPKCGTTSMWRYLRGHPEVFMSDVKEPNHFGSDVRSRSGLTSRRADLPALWGYPAPAVDPVPH